MQLLDVRVSHLLRNAWRFLWHTLIQFRANQGLLLAGAVGYYALLSIVPLLILMVIALSHVVEPRLLLFTVSRYLEWVVPGQSLTLIGELAAFLRNRGTFGWVLLATMLFFSSLAFTVLENAMSVIFVHRVAIRRRHFLVSAVLPYCFIGVLSVGLLIVTVVSGGLIAIGERHLDVLGREWSLGRLSTSLLYLIGFFGEIVLLASIYLVMPVGRLSLRHALYGAVLAAVLWEISRHVLVWYFTSLSQVGRVYGSLTTAIVVLLSLEIAATLLLLGAQVIAVLERGEWKKPASAPGPTKEFRT